MQHGLIQLPAETRKQLELMQLKARRAFLGQRSGGHRSLRRGHGIEFSDYRAYELGDNPRHIDWGVLARTDKVVVRRYQEEENLSVLVILDGSRSMWFPEEDHKWQRAVELTLAVVYVALQQHDSVTVLVPGTYRSPRMHSIESFHQLTHALNQLKPSEVTTITQAATSASELTRHPGLCVLISDLLAEPEDVRTGCALLAARGLDVQVLRVVGAGDRDPFGGSVTLREFIARDAESRARVTVSATEQERYHAAFKEHASALSRAVTQCKGTLAVVDADAPLSTALFKVMPALGVFS